LLKATIGLVKSDIDPAAAQLHVASYNSQREELTTYKEDLSTAGGHISTFLRTQKVDAPTIIHIP